MNDLFDKSRPRRPQRDGGRVIAIRGQQLPGRRGFVTTYTDVTEQRRFEASLKRSEEREEVDSYLQRERENSKFSFEDILSEELRLDRDEGDRPKVK